MKLDGANGGGVPPDNSVTGSDGLGSIVKMTDGAGAVAQAYEYDSFGKLHDKMNAVKQPYTYTGRGFDRETGLYYYRARYYDAEVGRFTSFDPIVHPGNGPPQCCSCGKIQDILLPVWTKGVDTGIMWLA